MGSYPNPEYPLSSEVMKPCTCPSKNWISLPIYKQITVLNFADLLWKGIPSSNLSNFFLFSRYEEFSPANLLEKIPGAPSRWGTNNPVSSDKTGFFTILYRCSALIKAFSFSVFPVSEISNNIPSSTGNFNFTLYDFNMC